MNAHNEYIDKDKRMKVWYTNLCEARVYVKACILKYDAKYGPSCGSFGVLKGKRGFWDAYNAPRDHSFKVVGSVKGGNDWVCAGKIEGWHDD